MDQYAAPWGIRTRRLTIFSMTVIILFPLFAWWQTPASEPLSLRLVLLLIPLVLLAATYCFKVEWYGLDDEDVVIKRVVGEKRIPYESIEAAEATPYVIDQSIRVMGNGGLFGFNGRFRNKILGPYRAYVTDPANCVVLRLTREQPPIVISPETPKPFVKALKEQRRKARNR